MGKITLTFKSKVKLPSEIKYPLQKRLSRKVTYRTTKVLFTVRYTKRQITAITKTITKSPGKAEFSDFKG
jgi:hypothetical protein